MNVYPFIEAEKAEQDGNVATACVLLKVSRSAYYEWSKHIPSARDLSDADLGDKIVDIHTKSRGTYGAPRIITKLAQVGICVGQKRVARLMVRRGLIGRCKRRFKVTTTPDPDAGSLAPDLIKRAFAPEAHELDTAWCGDITYIRTWEGWLYLATVIDLASRRVVGFAMADHMRADLVCDATEMATEQRRPAAGLTFHSDRGSQYTSEKFRELLADHEIVQTSSSRLPVPLFSEMRKQVGVAVGDDRRGLPRPRPSFVVTAFDAGWTKDSRGMSALVRGQTTST